MNKKTIILITIISSILSIIYILLTYYGIIRFYTIKNENTEKFINNYSLLEKASNKSKVVISLYWNNNNFDKLKPLINSLLDQTVKVDMIAINIPDNIDDKNIPQYIKNSANIFKFKKEYGESTNLIPTLFREKECDTIIIALKNYKMFGKDYIESLVNEIENNPDSIINHKDAIVVKPSFFGCNVLGRNETENITNDNILSKTKNKCLNFNYNETFNY
jgi:hypothetical protein